METYLSESSSRKQAQACRRLLHSPLQLPPTLLWFLGACTILTILSFTFSIVCRHLGLGLPYSFPYYYVPGDMFSDFRAFWFKFQQYHRPIFYTGEAGHFMYPLPLLFVFLTFFKTGHAFTSYVAAMIGITGVLVAIFSRCLRRAGLAGGALALFVSATVLLSYPLAYLYLRQNVEFVIFAITTAGVLAYWTGHSKTAAVCFGIAGACKIYPLMLLGLLFAAKRYGSVLLGVGVAVILFFGSLYAFGPSIHDAYRWDAFQLALFQKRFAGLPMHLGYDHSFLGLVKFVTLPWHPVLHAWVPVYTRVMAITALILYFTRIVRLPRFNQVMSLSILSVTLPPISYDYTLLAIYPPLVLLAMLVVRAARTQTDEPAMVRRLFVLLSVVLTPLSFVTFAGARFGAQVRCICLFIILVYVLVSPLGDKYWASVDDRLKETV